jgi:mannose-6-phosphate isomerase-like protein (cupin superfamily)
MNLTEIRESGLLELYVYGTIEEKEQALVLDALKKHPQLKQDLEEIELAMKTHAEMHAIQPHGAVKPLLLATWNYQERLKNGEKTCSPPLLNEHSKIQDYKEWLDREDMAPPEEMEAMYARIIGHEPEKLTAIVWLRFGAPDETHTDEYEKFLIVEGTCSITIEDRVHPLKPGDYMSIPLHLKHHVSITSAIPCKFILQRVAA